MGNVSAKQAWKAERFSSGTEGEDMYTVKPRKLAVRTPPFRHEPKTLHQQGKGLTKLNATRCTSVRRSNEVSSCTHGQGSAPYAGHFQGVGSLVYLQ